MEDRVTIAGKCTTCEDTIEHVAKRPREEAEALDTHALLRIAAAAVLFLVGTIFNSALHTTPFSIAEYAVLIPAYLLVGGPVLYAAWQNIRHGRVFDETFLMSISTIGAMLIHELPEAAGVMLFYSVGEFLQDRAVDRSRASIAALMDIRPESARVLVERRAEAADMAATEAGNDPDGRSIVPFERRIMSPEEVAVGMLIEVLPGERIPLDGTVVEGSSVVDTASLTGESMPRDIGVGDAVLAGFVNDGGRLVVRVEKKFAQSAVARILALVEEAESHKDADRKIRQ